MNITPDNIVIWQWGFLTLNATILCTWLVMALLVGVSWWATRRLSSGAEISRLQSSLEAIVEAVNEQIEAATHQNPRPFLPFIGTIFLFFVVANLLTIVPFYQSPAGSLSTTAGLALLVFFAVPFYGIKFSGLKGYLEHFIEPTPVMLPFKIVSEVSRTVSLAVRLFGNVMSASILVGILLSIVPLFVPIVMRLFGALVGFIQAYVFAILAIVYIASGIAARQQNEH